MDIGLKELKAIQYIYGEYLYYLDLACSYAKHEVLSEDDDQYKYGKQQEAIVEALIKDLK